MECCEKCGRLLSTDEIAVYRRMVSRSAERFLCKNCLAEYWGVPPAVIEEKIVHFRAMGCLLFG